jgi:hypothetical protein
LRWSCNLRVKRVFHHNLLLTFFYKSDFFIESFLQHMYGHHQEVLREAERCDQREKKVSPLVHQKNILKHKCFFLLIYFFKYIFSKLLTSHFLIIINWPALLMQKTGSNWIIWNHNICTLMMDYYLFFLHFRNIWVNRRFKSVFESFLSWHVFISSFVLVATMKS